MTPAEIAKAMTPAQVRALRGPTTINSILALHAVEIEGGFELVDMTVQVEWTPLGLAVLAELGKEDVT